MTQAERRLFLIQALKDEQAEYRDLRVPRDAMGQRKLLRSLLNVRAPGAIGDDFLAVQDDYLQQALAEDGVTRAEDLSPVSGDLCLWQGDITRLQCGAIVNAANSGLTGCYLPCDYVLHTVGPIVEGPLTAEHERLLASCYRACLALAEAHGVESIAFCCISTGVFRFPHERAAEIAVETVRRYKRETNSGMKVIFNVFKDTDYAIYQRLLRADRPPAPGALGR